MKKCDIVEQNSGRSIVHSLHIWLNRKTERCSSYISWIPLHASVSHKTIFDVKKDDIYWCTADVGWVTGHSYIIYGPLCNGSTTLMFEGVPTYPDASRFWQIVDKFKVNIFTQHQLLLELLWV